MQILGLSLALGRAIGVSPRAVNEIVLVTGQSLNNPFFTSAINRSRQVVYAG